MTHDLILICDGCGKPIADGHGYLWIDREAIARAVAAKAEWERKREADRAKNAGWSTPYNPLDAPAAVRWQAHHDDCDKGRGGDDYYVPSYGMRSWRQLLDWTAQVMEKSWIGLTDWPEVLRGVHGGNRRLIAARR